MTNEPATPPLDQGARWATDRVLRLTAVLWSAAWFLTLVITFVTDPTIVDSPLSASIGLTLLAGSWGVFVMVPRITSAQFVCVVSATGILSAAIIRLDDLPHHVLFVTTWLNLATIVAALLLPRHIAPAVIAFVSGLGLVILSVRLAGTPLDDPAWRSSIMAFAYALAIGMAVWVGASAVRRAADEADEADELARDTVRRQAEEAAHRQEVERMGRLLHDTCINTLGAIRDGLGQRMPDSVRERCAGDLSRLADADKHVQADSQFSVMELRGIVRDIERVVGVNVRLFMSAEDTSIDPVVWRAAAGAVREALVNVAKHTASARARVTISSESGVLTIGVEDEGPGWSGHYRPGGGIDRSIRSRVEGTGGTLGLTSAPTAGTRLTFTWPQSVPPPTSGPKEGTRSGADDGIDVGVTVRAGLRRVVIGAGGWMLGYALVSTVMFIGFGTNLGSAVALAILASCLLVVARRPRFWLPGWTSLVLTAAIALVVALPANDGSCITTNPAAWGPDGAAILVLIACLLGANWWSPTLAALAFVFGLGVPMMLLDPPSDTCTSTSITVLLIEVGAVMVIFSFRRLLVRTWTSAARYRHQAAVVEASAIDAAARSRARQARLGWTVSGAGDLMRQIADGVADPAADSVRARAAEVEATLRSLLVLDPSLGRLGDALSESLTQAMDSGRRLEARSGGPVPQPTPAQVLDLRRLIAEIIASCPPGSVIPMGLFTEADGGMLTLVTPMMPRIADSARHFESGIMVNVQYLDDEILVEARWPLESASDPSPEASEGSRPREGVATATVPHSPMR